MHAVDYKGTPAWRIAWDCDQMQAEHYVRRSENEYIERKIWDNGLRDLGTLPQFLLGKSQQELRQDIAFSAINYDDGKVYPLIAKRAGFRNVMVDGVRVRCAIYDVTVDSWLSVFVGKTRLLIPINGQNSNFVAYSGPGLDGATDFWSLRLIGRDKTLAMLKAANKIP